MSLELPLVVCDIQRGGPSTGLPTKTEQADLLQALFGRNGESPVAVVAPATPADCFDIAIEAVRIATTYRTPVIVLSDGYLANGSEPWRLPRTAELPDLSVEFATEPNDVTADGAPVFHPYLRDPETLARPWAIPGTPGLEHRIGGIEKADVTGNISYDPDNHDQMVRLRQAKIDGIADTIPPLAVDDPTGDAEVLVVGWGSTYGPIAAGVRLARAAGARVAQAHLRHLNPFPANTGQVLRRYQRVIVPEMNLGQLAMLLRAQFLVDVQSHTSVRGLPFQAAEIADVISHVIGTPCSRRVPSQRACRRVCREHEGDGQVTPPTLACRPTPCPQSRPVGVAAASRPCPRSATATALTKKDFTSDQEVRWCPGLRRLRDPRRGAGLPARARASSARTSSSSRASGAARASRTTSTPTACTRSTAAPRPSRPGWRRRARTCRSGSSPVTATPCRSAATTSSTRCAATSTSRSCSSTTRSTA